MFVNQQDTCLLHNSLLSAVKRNQPEDSDTKRKYDLDDDNETIVIVSSTISSLTQGTIRTNPIDEALDKQLHLQRRCHAAIFFTVLKSNGIHCAEATAYYENIAHTFPLLSWKFYMKLNLQCKWSEYFIECCKELPPDILSTVLKKILSIEWDEEQLKYYSWHVILQAIIWKFFVIEDSSLSFSQNCCSFAFPFVSSNLKTETSSPPIIEQDEISFAKSQLLHSFVTILNNLQSTSISCFGSFDFIKIILHAYKTIFKLLSKVKTYEMDIVKELFRLNKLFGNCCSEKQSVNVIEAILQSKDEKIPLSHYYAVTSWEISANYLVFLLCCYWRDVLELITEEGDSPYFPLKECLPPRSDKELLKNLSPLLKDKFEQDDTNYILSLRIIISLNYPCATRAAITLMQHPEVRESDEVLAILEGTAQKLSAFEVYPVLVDAIATYQSKDAKMRLLNLFFKILSESSVKIYNDALSYILNEYGANDYFQLNDFDDQLNCFTRRLMSNDEAEKCLLPLFVQSPRDVLKMLIEQALLQRSNEKTVLKILNHIPVACLYSDSLVEELKPYFINEIDIKVMNNMMSLIDSLMKIHAETSIMDFNKFLEEIIVPNLESETKVFYTLECLNVSLNVLASNKVLKIKLKALSLLIKCLSSIIDKCIKLGDGGIKELAVTALSILSETQGMPDSLKAELWCDLSCYSPSVLVYFMKLFEKTYDDLKGTISTLDDSWWIWSCNFQDATLFQKTISEKKITYEDLVGILIPVLPHLTKEEWFATAQLIREFAPNSNLDLSYSVPWLLPKSNPQVYAVIRCLTDSFYFTLKKTVYDLNYISNCYTNTVQSILNQELNLHLYLNIFLDLCHLTMDNTDEVYTSLLPFLLTVKKSIEDECKDKSWYNKAMQVVFKGIKCLPNSDEKLPFFISNSEQSVN